LLLQVEAIFYLKIVGNIPLLQVEGISYLKIVGNIPLLQVQLFILLDDVYSIVLGFLVEGIYYPDVIVGIALRLLLVERFILGNCFRRFLWLRLVKAF
jgi:hypothetical protein